ncbi:MAG: hypothetical protein M3N25_06305, partial [Actinomycetota bacterium]|nr:hypothetical protein [Actinomycetota bacterium]
TKVYVCNLAPQLPETEGFDVAAHVAALEAHGVVPDVVLCHPGGLALGQPKVPVVEREVAADGEPGHDPVRLAAALSDLLGWAGPAR